MAKSCFDVQKKTILESGQRFFAVVLSIMDLANVDFIHGKYKFSFEQM